MSTNPSGSKRGRSASMAPNSGRKRKATKQLTPISEMQEVNSIDDLDMPGDEIGEGNGRAKRTQVPVNYAALNSVGKGGSSRPDPPNQHPDPPPPPCLQQMIKRR